jgi:hypothetical protein
VLIHLSDRCDYLDAETNRPCLPITASRATRAVAIEPRKYCRSIDIHLFVKTTVHSLSETADLGYEVIGLNEPIEPEQARHIDRRKVTLLGCHDLQNL